MSYENWTVSQVTVFFTSEFPNCTGALVSMLTSADRHAIQGRGEIWTNESWEFCWRCRVIGRKSIPQLRCKNREESQLCWVDFFCSHWWRYQPASWCSREKCWGLWSEQRLGVDRCGSVDSLEGQHHGLELDEGCNRSRRRGSHWRIWVDWKRGALQHSG